MKTIKSYEDACTKLGVDANALPDVSMLEEKHQKSVISYCKLIRIAEVLNGKWKADYSNYDQYKYFPYLVKNAAGFGFSHALYVRWFTFTTVGSRLVYKDRKTAEYAATQFIDLYNDYLSL